MNHHGDPPAGMFRCPKCGNFELNSAQVCSCCGRDFQHLASSIPDPNAPIASPFTSQVSQAPPPSPYLQSGNVSNLPPNPSVPQTHTVQGPVNPGSYLGQSAYGMTPMQGMTTPNPSNLSPEAQAAAMQLDQMTAQAAAQTNMAMSVLAANQYGGMGGLGGRNMGRFRNPNHRIHRFSWWGVLIMAVGLAISFVVHFFQNRADSGVPAKQTGSSYSSPYGNSHPR